MHLASVRLIGLDPFEDLTLSLAKDGAPPQPQILIFGGCGTGKTTILNSIANTRPGFAIPLLRNRNASPAFAVTTWQMGQDDPMRPHPLRIISPNASLNEPEDTHLRHQREQALYSKRAGERGFALLYFPSVRWFSRTPVLLTAPERTITRYDVRTSYNPEDATRNDLARETKQALCYAPLAAALCEQEPESPSQERLRSFDQAIRKTVSSLTSLTGHPFLGVDPSTLEPIFRAPTGGRILFDDLPTATRNLAAFGALTLRTVFAAYPDLSPLQAEAVVLIDDVELHQEASVTRKLLPALRHALPRVQWILTTNSTALLNACESSHQIALRRTPPSQQIEIFEGMQAITH